MTQDLFDHQAASKIALQQALNDLAKARSRVARNEEALRALGLHDEDINAQTSGRVPVVTFVNNHFAGYGPATVEALKAAIAAT